MKGFRPFPRWVIGSSLALLPLILNGNVLGDGETIVQLDPSVSIPLPAGWKAVYQGPFEPSDKRSSVGFDVPKAEESRLVFTAVPTDEERKAFITVFSTDYHRSSPPLTTPFGLSPEADRFINGILAQGFVPLSVEATKPDPHDPIGKIVVKAASTNGEVRIFNNLAWQNDRSTITRIHYSHDEHDPLGPGELTALIATVTPLVQKKAPEGESEAGMRSVPAELADRIRSMREKRGIPMSPFGGSNENLPSNTYKEFYPSLILVDGAKGRGSGFLYRDKGTIYAATNAHVLSGNPGFKLTTLQGAQITSPSAFIAHGADLVQFTIPEATTAIDLIKDFESTVQIGDRVVVLGNAEGAGVVHPIEGTITGIGPDLVEVSAPFVKGNSGSPIIHLKSRQVIGIATYLTKKEGDGTEGPSHPKIRRFGYRLDTIKVWEPVNWQRFFAQSAEVEKIKALSGEFMQLGSITDTRERFNPSNYGILAIQRPLRNFQNALLEKGRSLSPIDRKNIGMRFLAELRIASRSDIANFDSRNAYDYFKREVDEQREFREGLYEKLNQIIQNGQR